MAGDAPVEWGVLWSRGGQGLGRYGMLDDVAALGRAAWDGGSRLALHVCGRDVAELLAGTGCVSEVATLFPRVQVNLRADTWTARGIRDLCGRLPGTTVITQHNAANADLWSDLAGVPNHAVLFDASGGRGASPETWPAPLPGKLCGYAGGLGPGNLAAELRRISEASAGLPTWVDMEGRLRDEGDRFVMDRARACVAALRSHLADVRP